MDGAYLEKGAGWCADRRICTTTKLTGGNGAQRNCRPVERLVSRFVNMYQYFQALQPQALENIL